jgi:hypothetical protein
VPRGVLSKANTARHAGRGLNPRPYSAEVLRADFAASGPPPPLSLSQLWAGVFYTERLGTVPEISDRMLVTSVATIAAPISSL